MNDKGKFLKLLAALEDQYRNDRVVQMKVQKIYGKDAHIPMHNVDALVVPVVETMADMVAMPSSEAEERIFNYMYACDFGKAINSTGDELWDMLNKTNKQ